MTVTVVRGFVGSSSSSSDAKGAKAPSLPAASSAQAQAVAAVSSVTAGLNEASVATIRLAKSVTVGDKIREAREAKELSESLAERIADKDDSVDAHSELTPVSAREHFA